MKKIGFLLIVIIAISGCATPRMSTAKYESITTRQFRASYENVFDSTLWVLQNIGYSIEIKNKMDGIIEASEYQATTFVGGFFQGFFSLPSIKGVDTMVKANIIQISENVQTVQISFQKIKYGATSSGRLYDIYDKELYSQIFSKISSEIQARENQNIAEIIPKGTVIKGRGLNTYKNNSLGFSIDYPKTWMITKKIGKNEIIYINFTSPIIKKDSISVVVGIENLNDNIRNPKEYLMKDAEKFCNYYQCKKKETINISEREAFLISYIEKAKGKTITRKIYSIICDSRIYRIASSCTKTNCRKYSSQLDSLVSSFKVLEDKDKEVK